MIACQRTDIISQGFTIKKVDKFIPFNMRLHQSLRFSRTSAITHRPSQFIPGFVINLKCSIICLIICH